LAPINEGSAGVKWFFGDGNTSNLSKVTHRYLNPGVYNVKLILTNILNGCKDSTTIPVNIETSSLSSDKILPSFQYYPNPSNGFVKIVCSEIMEGGKLMHLLNTSGQVVKSQLLYFENGGAIIDLNGLSNGLYLLKIEGYQTVVLSKLE
jgi:PKD repeat protein